MSSRAAGQVPRRPGPRPGQPAGVSHTTVAQVRTDLQGSSPAERNWSDQVLGALPIASSSGPASRRPSTRLIRIRAGTSLPAPGPPEATASRKVAERLSASARAGKTTACGVVSLRRHCPDQVPGGRRSASELSPASQPFLPAPGLPGARSVQLPRSPRRRYSRCMGPVTAPRAESPARTGRTSCFSEARGLAGRRRSCFQSPPARLRASAADRTMRSWAGSGGRERRTGRRARTWAASSGSLAAHRAGARSTWAPPGPAPPRAQHLAPSLAAQRPRRRSRPSLSSQGQP